MRSELVGSGLLGAFLTHSHIVFWGLSVGLPRTLKVLGSFSERFGVRLLFRGIRNWYKFRARNGLEGFSTALFSVLRVLLEV